MKECPCDLFKHLPLVFTSEHTNVTDKNDTAGLTNDDETTQVITNEEPINIPSKASPDRSIADSGMGASLAPSVVSTQKYSQLDDESDWSDGSF